MPFSPMVRWLGLRTREGVVISAGAGMLVIDALEHGLCRIAKPIADAYHTTA